MLIKQNVITRVNTNFEYNRYFLLRSLMYSQKIDYD